MRTVENSSGLVQWQNAVYWDKPWNPWVGCRPVSPACDNCYARAAMEDRFGQSFEPHRTKRKCIPTKGVVFCGNMTDLFGEWVDRDEAVENISLSARAICGCESVYMWCTKRVQRMKDALDEMDGRLNLPDGWFSNSWFGFTAENQETFDERSMCANAFPDWANVWVSAEPLLGRVELRGDIMGRIGWVAVGCESGGSRRPCRTEWVEDIVGRCMDAGIPVFVKQLDIDGRCERDIGKFPEHLKVRQVPWKTKR